MVLGIQIVGIVFMLIMLYMTFLFYKRNNYNRAAFIFWAFVWIVAALLVTFPDTFSAITQSLKFARTTDLYVVMAIMFFGVVTFFNYAKVQKQERKIEELVRATAMKRRK